jgi:putative FmdB family regulatory protein
MPMYLFHCKKCECQFEELCSFSEIAKVKCEVCGKKAHQLPTSPSAIIFKEKKGTSRENNFDYVAKWNAEQNQNLRRAAERINTQGEVYKHIDDMSQYEGKIK